MARQMKKAIPDLKAPPSKPVVWLVRRKGTDRAVHVVVQTAYFAFQQGSVLLKDDAAAPCLDLDAMTATVRDLSRLRSDEVARVMSTIGGVAA